MFQILTKPTPTPHAYNGKTCCVGYKLGVDPSRFHPGRWKFSPLASEETSDNNEHSDLGQQTSGNITQAE